MVKKWSSASQPRRLVKKEKARPRNIKIRDDKRKEEYIRSKERRRQEKEYEHEFLEDLETSLFAHN